MVKSGLLPARGMYLPSTMGHGPWRMGSYVYEVDHQMYFDVCDRSPADKHADTYFIFATISGVISL